MRINETIGTIKRYDICGVPLSGRVPVRRSQHPLVPKNGVNGRDGQCGKVRGG